MEHRLTLLVVFTRSLLGSICDSCSDLEKVLEMSDALSGTVLMSAGPTFLTDMAT